MAPALELGIAVTLDLLIGDPRGWPHPVRGLGWIAARLEVPLRGILPARGAGVLFWFLIVGIAAAVVWMMVTKLGAVAGVYWTYALLAIRSLDHETAHAAAALARGDLEAARAAIAMVVGRDTADLDEAGVLRAAIETMAENLSDAVVAPLFYWALGGPALMAAYKAVNTLDSMVGYKNERYREFGWWSARADDWANWIPARLTAVLIALAAWLLPGLRAAEAWRIAWRDGGSQPSPNSGWPEAAAAGALGVQLGGLNFYQGVASRKARLGDPARPLDLAAYRDCRHLHYAVSLLAAVLAAAAGSWIR
jgi:adenosylcobinamide-phosphate synthase